MNDFSWCMMAICSFLALCIVVLRAVLRFIDNMDCDEDHE